jgi:kynurenine formamidase
MGIARSNKRQSGDADMRNFLRSVKVVDLTHTFSPDIPIPDGLPRPQVESIYDGAIQVLTHVGQYGTHLDAPGHFHKGMRLVHELPVGELLLEGCAIDISGQAALNPDYRLSRGDIQKWEDEFGPVPAGSLVISYTGWSRRWTDPAVFFNKDAAGICHYPGWGMDAVRYLIDVRNIRAIAHETPDTDSGATCGPQKGWPVESYVLGRDRWQVENLNIPVRLPARGFVVFVGVPKGEAITGFPARVIALVP